MQNGAYHEPVSEELKKAEYNAIKPISFQEFEVIVNKWMLIVDPGVVALLPAIVHANLFPSDPVWLFLLGNSAGGKTELLNMFLQYPDCYFLSQLTPNTFLSGFKGSKEREPSLLHQLGTNKTIIFKDFTSLLDGNSDAFKEIIGQLREIFDGHVKKRLGTGDEITWTGKMGFIAGCTPILEQRMNLIGAMGERFLSYKMKQPKREELRARMRQNIGKETEMRREIQEGLIGLMKGLKIPEELPPLPDEVNKTIEALTDFVAISRAVVMRGYDTKKEIEYIADPEGTGRIYKQFYTIAMSLYNIRNGNWTDTDNYILRKLAICSVHSIRYRLIRMIQSYKGQVKTSTLAMALGYPTSTTRRYLEDLSAISMDDGEIKILNRTHQGKGKADLWSVTPTMKKILVNMGDAIEATKTDDTSDQNEEDTPVGTAPEEDKLVEVDDITEGMTKEELISLGL